jgi:hypothetical protein
MWFPGGVPNSNSSGLLVSLSYRTCVWVLAVPCGAWLEGLYRGTTKVLVDTTRTSLPASK